MLMCRWVGVFCNAICKLESVCIHLYDYFLDCLPEHVKRKREMVRVGVIRTWCMKKNDCPWQCPYVSFVVLYAL